uniref:Cat eye syndrome critical region protein 2 n=1 Tax=Zeugodacus cucurbitae TaxID=28588 RepID=A0A0A1XGU0_ZEUCU
MVSTFIGLLDIQSWWEIPCISHFCSLFSSAFDLPDIDIEDLESALLSDGTDEDQIALVPELIVRLLKGCDALKSVAKEITHSNYQMFLRRFLRQQCRIHNTENHFDTDIDFQSLPVRKRLQILQVLCHFRLDSCDVQVILSNLEADSLRVEPLGYDSKNSGYWYFYGTRLYREDKPASSVNSYSGIGGSKSTTTTVNGKGGENVKCAVWQVICFTEEDWQNLASKFKSSTNAKERELYQILDENFLPKLPQLFRERERLRRRKLLQVRNSTRIRNIVELKARQEQERLLRERQRYQFEPPTNLKHQQLSSVQSRARRRLARELATTTRTSTTTTRDSQN